jgi:hypothetical protein
MSGLLHYQIKTEGDSVLYHPGAHLFLQGKFDQELGDGVFAARAFDKDEPLQLFAFGLLTSKAAYEVLRIVFLA